MAIESEGFGHRAFIYDRGGEHRLYQLHNLNLCRWNRKRDDISDAKIVIPLADMDEQAETLDKITPGRHELVIFRGDDDDPDARVWEGPVNLPKLSANGFELTAKDVNFYAARTIMRAAYDNSYPNTEYVTTRLKNIYMAELARKEALDPPINVLPHLVEHHFSTDAQTSAATLPFQYYVWMHADTMAARAGVDYTTIGRAIHFWDTSQPVFGYTPMLTAADFDSAIEWGTYGTELATHAAVTDGQGNWGEVGANDPVLGEWEHLATAYDENATTAPTVAELESQAMRNLAGRNPAPTQLRVPENSSINLDGALEVRHLVPGVYIPVNITIGKIVKSQMLKLNTVQFEETAKGEEITMACSPATSSDEPEEP